MRAILLVVLLAPALAAGQGLSKYGPGQKTKLPPSTNYVKYSNSISNVNLARSPWSLYQATISTPEAAPAAQGGGTWAQVVSTSSAGFAVAPATLPSSTAFISSAWMVKASGTGYAGVMAGSGLATTPTTCTCWRSDGGTCTATKLAAGDAGYCLAEVSDLGTTPVRLALAMVLAGARTDMGLYLIPGQKGTATGTTKFAGAQVEVISASKPGKLCVTGATVPLLCP